ncbi:MAG: DUF4097 domain-containing protein [Ignavibacteria bacterium]|jgi:DUF4097 and DUF4098 domain-containing protein YvlB|nr:DUF4097 domain-containing protein [Ignavibacteria bacterium]MCU7502433.1 DUF4097 domain-containing protein [Ignavibacteria bacterium]MCU7515002.1 DUF4097 domain-containing protein [Ignavibacteria bacterium]
MKSVYLMFLRGLGLFLMFILTLDFVSVSKAGDLRTLQERTFNTSMGKKLELNTSSGDVYISTWDRPEVYVKVSGNKRASDKMHFNLQGDNSGVRMEGKSNSSWFSLGWNSVYVKYEIKLPNNYNAFIRTSGGDIKIYDLNGTIKFETSGGDISLFNTKGNTNISTSGGDIKLENTKGDMKISTSGGDIQARNFEGNLKASTSGGDMKLQGKGGRVEASTTGGDITLDYFDTNYGIDLETSGGDITVKVPGNFSADADISTTGGEVECLLPITQTGKLTSSKLKGALNGGGKTLHCYTSGGDIKILK